MSAVGFERREMARREKEQIWSQPCPAGRRLSMGCQMKGRGSGRANGRCEEQQPHEQPRVHAMDGEACGTLPAKLGGHHFRLLKNSIAES